MTSWMARKLAELCCYPGCEKPPLDDNCLCAKHAKASRRRNREWARRKKRAEVQP